MSKSAARFAQFRAEKAAGAFGAMFVGGKSWSFPGNKKKLIKKRKRKQPDKLSQAASPELERQAQFKFGKPYSQLSKAQRRKVARRVASSLFVQSLINKPANRPTSSNQSGLPSPARTIFREPARVESPSALNVPVSKERLIQLQTGKPAALTYNELVFRVLLQREERRPKLTFAALEGALPKSILKVVEPDWRAYIRNENLEYDSAYQKAVRKHLPGIYHVVMAAEFLGKLPFHVALGHFLKPEAFPWERLGISEDDTFALAERLADEVRRHRAEVTQLPPAGGKPRTTIAISGPPATGLVPKSAGVTPRLTGPTRRCAFCRMLIPISEISRHVENHINPPHLATRQLAASATPVVSAAQVLTGTSVPEAVPVAMPTYFNRFNSHRCIGCGKTAIPGDFYCYGCAPD